MHPPQKPFPPIVIGTILCLGVRLILPFSGIIWHLSLVKKNNCYSCLLLPALQTGYLNAFDCVFGDANSCMCYFQYSLRPTQDVTMGMFAIFFLEGEEVDVKLVSDNMEVKTR